MSLNARTAFVRHGLLAGAVFLFAVASVVNAESDADGQLYAASEAPLMDVQHVLNAAAANGKKGLIVLGANWCHDSRALAARLKKSPLSDVVQTGYELVFVDVGFYEDRSDVLRSFGVQQYYATPTVLIVEPESGQLLNDEDRHIWSNAYNIDMSSSVEYFEKWAAVDSIVEPVSDELQRLYQEIKQFESQQASRVAGGYAVVGPMLKALKEGNRPDDFRSRWDELRDFRIRVWADIRALREEAGRRVSAGEADIELEYPRYPALSWESN
ncbi:MAG: thioredoxin family protein [Pseudomonadota bacterium]